MEQWSSRLGFILAAIGAAVGLGNIWRFPAVVGQNGGGAYLVPYLIAAFAFAIPLLILEISVGRSLKADVVTACRQVKAEYEILGWIIGGSVLAVLSYYLVITGWVLAFFVFALVGAEVSFGAFTATNLPLLFFLTAGLIVGGIVSLGVNDGIERMATVLIPMTFLILVLLGGYVTTLDGFGRGLRFFLTPDPTVLTDPFIWSAAFGQIFFSFSVGMGVLLTYGSYLPVDAKVSRSAIAIALADLAVALLAGLVIFAIVFSFDLEPTSGSELAFTTLPAGFEAMPFGTVVAIAFFGLLFFAAIAPSVSMIEVGVAGAMRATGWTRRRASVTMTALVLLAGFPSALSYSAVEFSVLGRPFLDVVDSTVGTYALPFGALAIVGVFVWAQDPALVRKQIDGTLVLPLVKYVVPAVLIVVTGVRLVTGVSATAWHRLPDGLVVAPVAGFASTIALGIVLGVIGFLVYRWHRGGGGPTAQQQSSRR